MFEENISQEFRLKNIRETRNYFLEEIKQNELITKQQKKFYTTLNHIEHFLIQLLQFGDEFASLIGISVGIMSFAIGLKICARAAGIKSISQ